MHACSETRPSMYATLSTFISEESSKPEQAPMHARSLSMDVRRHPLSYGISSGNDVIQLFIVIVVATRPGARAGLLRACGRWAWRFPRQPRSSTWRCWRSTTRSPALAFRTVAAVARAWHEAYLPSVCSDCIWGGASNPRTSRHSAHKPPSWTSRSPRHKTSPRVST